MAAVPKRESQRRRTNKPVVPVDHVQVDSVVRGPELGFAAHPLAAEWYESLRVSGQSVFFEPSDWATARVWTDLLSRVLSKGSPSAMMVSAWASGATELMTTEGSRRRMRLELERAKPVDVDDEAAVAMLDEYRGRFSG